MRLCDEQESRLCSSWETWCCCEVMLQVPSEAPQCSRCQTLAMPLREQHSFLCASWGGSEVVLQVPREASHCGECLEQQVPLRELHSLLWSSWRTSCGCEVVLQVPSEACQCSGCQTPHKKCLCGSSRPSFGLPGDIKARWCARCPDKPPDAVDVTNKKYAQLREQRSLLWASWGEPGCREVVLKVPGEASQRSEC